MIIYIALAVVVISGIVVWQYANKSAPKAEDAKSIIATAKTLVTDYSTDENAANLKYLNNAIEVSGTVAEVTKNQDGKTVVLLQADDPMSGVQCTLREHAPIQVGKQITLKGFCTGYTLVVLLSDCIIL